MHPRRPLEHRAALPDLPELWGGVECTVNRVGNETFDQLVLSGHADRLSDLLLFRDLGITRVRYPVLWERVCPQPGHYHWRWTDERLGALRDLGIDPIVGLLHHGSGPRDTGLLDPAFPEKFARFAREVASRYPWVTAYTPINEPLTTARFSCLYGLWYPHERNDGAFLRAFFNECRATVLAMAAIREIQPDAKLVQTEDLGRAFATPPLEYQATFENQRRWLTWDLLCGRVQPGHPLWEWIAARGIRVHALEFFARRPTPPDLIGINHYITSCRFLDHRLDRYPAVVHGGNGIDRYADVEKPVAPDEELPAMDILRETWERYGIPLAITEAHRGGARNEQLGWLSDMWEICRRSRRDGIDVVAMTAWALVGSFNWNHLVTRNEGYYEPGAFCVRGGTPRPTAIARFLQTISAGRRAALPFLRGRASRPRDRRKTRRTRLLIIGTGTLGRAFARVCDHRGLEHTLVGRGEVDIADSKQITEVLDGIRPWGVINAAGYVKVDDAEENHAQCYRENVEGAVNLAVSCRDHRLPFVTFSSDLVFDGTQATPYHESSPVAPLNVYGASKAEAERRVLGAYPSALVVRTSAFFGPWDEANFVTHALRCFTSNRTIVAASDVQVSPTFVPQLAHATLDLLIDGENGLWHIANAGSVTWADLARALAIQCHANTELVQAVPIEALGTKAARPKFSALASERSNLLPHWEEALSLYMREVAA